MGNAVDVRPLHELPLDVPGAHKAWASLVGGLGSGTYQLSACVSAPARLAGALFTTVVRGGRTAGLRPPRGSRIRTAADVAGASAHSLAGLQRECVVVVVCDAGDRLRATVTVSEGALDRAMFPVREILHAVLVHDGRSFAVAHNHPSGDPEPSPADVQATRAIRDAARVVGLRFLGHVVVVEDGWQEVS